MNAHNAHAHDDIEVEPIPGLPSELPPGEVLLWQGRPAWRRLARDAMHVNGLAVYFAVFAAARGAIYLANGAGVVGALKEVAIVAPFGALAVAIGWVLAWLYARSTVYTITSKRLVMRIGVALPITFNLPFRQFGAVDVRVNKDGSGDVSVALSGSNRLGWVYLWPHVRPWHLTKAQPMFRSIPNVKAVGEVLAQALQEAALTPAPQRAAPQAPSAPTTTASPTVPHAPEADHRSGGGLHVAALRVVAS